MHKEAYQKLIADYDSLEKKYKELKKNHGTILVAKETAEGRIETLSTEINRLNSECISLRS